MGHGIAQVMASSPGSVHLYDLSAHELGLAQTRIQSSLQMFERHNLIETEEAEAMLNRISTTIDLEEAVRDASFVVEAVPEDLTLKQKLFVELDRLAPDDSILATNTSSLRIGEVSAEVGYPERVVGSHFFLPAQVIPLVEVSRGSETSDETMDRTVALWRACGKEPIRVEQDIPGYIANRLQGALVREATSLLGRGVATAEDIDRAVRTSFGLRYLVSGPLEQRDLGGLDLHVRIGRELWPDLNVSPGPHQFIVDKVDRGELGIKSGKGFIDWTDQDQEEVLKDRTETLVEVVAKLKLIG